MLVTVASWSGEQTGGAQVGMQSWSRVAFDGCDMAACGEVGLAALVSRACGMLVVKCLG